MANFTHSIIPSVVLAALALCGTAWAQQPASNAIPQVRPPAFGAANTPQPKQTYVLVHGAWAGAWQWKKVGESLQADGHTVYRPTLTGQGERVHLATPDIDLNTHISDIANVILFEDLHDVVLMGHSYGGMVITGVADRFPERIKALIYVDAFLPNDGESASAAIGRPGGGPGMTGAFLNPGGWPYSPGKLPPYDVPQPGKTFSQPVSLKNPATRAVPSLYILTVDPGKKPEDDMFFKFYQRAKDRGWTTRIMEGDHVVSVSRPAELVKLLEEAPFQAKASAEAKADVKVATQ